MFSEEFLLREYWGNSVMAYLWFFGIILIGWIIKRQGSRLLSRLMFRFFKGYAKNAYADEFVELLRKPFEVLFVLFILYMAFEHIQYPPEWKLGTEDKFGVKMFVNRTYETLLGAFITWVFLRTIDFIAFVQCERSKNGEINTDVQLVFFVKELSKVILATIGLFAILSNVYNLNITAIVTSLGIGGLAIALAAQETLANLLGSFIIFLDKPFASGDLVETPEFKGTVESVGFRSTKIRTLDRSLLIVPNKKMIDTYLNNITRSTQRRVKFTVGLTYTSSREQLMQVVKDIKQTIDAHPQTVEEAVVAFSDFKDSDLDITVIYFVNTNDWDIMIKVKEEINLRIMEIVERNGCAFAFPTSTVYVEQNKN